MSAKGSENLTAAFDTGNRPTNSMTTSGYMQIRWYQQSTHSGYNMTSLKKRLPKVATQATNQALKSVFMHKD